MPQGKYRTDQIDSDTSVTGLLTPGNIDLSSRPVLRNKDGSVSTEISKSWNFDGKEVLLPTIVNGKRVSDKEAIDHYRNTGEHLGIFDTPEHATLAADKIHNRSSSGKGKFSIEEIEQPRVETPSKPTAWEQIKTSLKNNARGVIDMLSAPFDMTGKTGTRIYDSAVAAQKDQVDKAKSAYQSGDTFGTAVHGTAAAIPILGPWAEQTGEKFNDRPYEAATDVAIAALPFARKPLAAGAKTTVAAGRGAVQAATAPSTVRIPYVGKVTAPAIVADTVKGAGMGYVAGGPLPIDASTGAGVGAALAAGRTLARGAKAGILDYQKSQLPPAAPPPPRSPLWAGSPEPTPIARPVPVAVEPPSLPSGRKPGGIQNQKAPAAPQAAAEPVAVAPDPLDAIAADIGYKKPYAKLTAAQQLEVKIAEKAAAQAAEKSMPTAKAPSTDTTPFGQAMRTAIEKLKKKGELPKDWQPGLESDTPPGELARFDLSEEGAAVIDSTKSRFNKPVANPGLLKASQLDAVIKSLEKETALTEGKRALLTQLREELGKRAVRKPQASESLEQRLRDSIEAAKKAGKQ